MPTSGGRTRPSMEARQRGAPAAAAGRALWGHEHLPLLASARSKDSVEYILQALWRTRRTGLDAADRAVVRDILQISTDSELDPLLACLRILIRRCVHENVAKDDVAKLFPEEVLPELKRLLTLLLQKFQPEWRQDASKDQGSAQNSGTTKSILNTNQDVSEQSAITEASAHNSRTTKSNLSANQDVSEQPAIAELHCGTSAANVSSESGVREGKLPLAKDSLDKMLKDIYPTMGQVSNVGNANRHGKTGRST
ncbi:hypothetical protein ACQ4PT_026995 [Festuca glaucescens]